MYSSKRGLAALVAACALLGAVAAPTAEVAAPGPPPLERLVKPLGLSAAQQGTLKPMFAQAQAQAAEDVKQASSDGKKPDPTELMKTLQMHEADFRLRLAAVLSPEQLAAYEKMTASSTPRAQSSEMHNAHGHRESDTPATAIDR